MPTITLTELWLCSRRVFPYLEVAVRGCQMKPAKTPAAYTRQLLKELRRMGVKAEPIKGESCALLLADKLWVQVVGPDADLADQAVQLRATMRQRALARGGYILQLGPKHGWRWVQIGARPSPSGETAAGGAIVQGVRES